MGFRVVFVQDVGETGEIDQFGFFFGEFTENAGAIVEGEEQEGGRGGIVECIDYLEREKILLVRLFKNNKLLMKY